MALLASPDVSVCTGKDCSMDGTWSIVQEIDVDSEATKAIGSMASVLERSADHRVARRRPRLPNGE
ncbi:hypothetical protein [Roseobacter cerasinus]|uniref:hypothetical protein n=1 Tax=Roseobacter cerasinus TaxID=2602289 RepID=UPI0013586275|nr:hypothetical protein [Roseobacter cerasinus]